MPSISAHALYNACAAGDAAAVSRLLPPGGTPRNLSGQRLQSPRSHQGTPLIIAAELGHMHIVGRHHEVLGCLHDHIAGSQEKRFSWWNGLLQYQTRHEGLSLHPTSHDARFRAEMIWAFVILSCLISAMHRMHRLVYSRFVNVCDSLY